MSSIGPCATRSSCAASIDSYCACMAGYLPLIRSRWKAATTADSQRISRNRDECILSCSNDSGVARSLQVGEHFHRRRVSRCGSEAPYRPSAVECAVLGVSVVGEGRRTRSTGISQVRASAARTGNGRRRNRRPLGREYAVAVRCAALTSATHADAGPHEPVSHFVFRALHASRSIQASQAECQSADLPVNPANAHRRA